MIVVATEAERKVAQERWVGEKIIVTGVGGLNIYKSLSLFDKGTQIVNFGYAGSNCIEIGTEVEVGKCSLYHPNVEYCECSFDLDGDAECYTSCDFVLQTEIERPVVFDMELAFILAMGFENVKSIKVVSDNLSLKQYEESTE